MRFSKNIYRAVDKFMKPDVEPTLKGCGDRKTGLFLPKNLEKLLKENPDLANRLKKTDPPPEIQVIFSRTGLPVIKIGQTTFHSTMDPEKEAGNWAVRADVSPPFQGDNRVAVFGFGMGYHVKALLDRRCPSVTVLEPRLDILRVALEWGDFSEYMKRITWVVDFQNLPSRKFSVLLRHQPSTRYYRDIFRLWEERLTTGDGHKETMGDLLESFKDHREIAEFLRVFSPEEAGSLDKLAERIVRDRGPLKDWQIVFLLMKEFRDRGATP
jgi:hypothetical protein